MCQRLGTMERGSVSYDRQAKDDLRRDEDGEDQTRDPEPVLRPAFLSDGLLVQAAACGAF